MKIAIIHPGNRVEKMYFPLQATEATVDLDPTDRSGYDILLADNADRDLGTEVLRRPIEDGKLVYRMRGDVFHELDLWDMAPHKKFIAKKLVLPNVAGCIAVTDWMAEKFKRKTGVTAGAAGLPKRVDDWPSATHRWEELRLSTLTNANYMKKIQAIVDWAPVVNDTLAETGGWWEVCGNGKYAGWLAESLAEYDHIQMVGYVDATHQLDKSNAMLHPSYLDGQPNGILEGLASGLPVLTNDFKAFRQFQGPIGVCANRGELVDELYALTDPDRRADAGRRGQQYVREYHNRAAVGEQYLEYFEWLLDQ